MCESNSKPIKLIAAACRNLGIGLKGCLPWKLPNEYKYFINNIISVNQPGKKNLIILGRKSFESFEDGYLPLPNCIIALLSKNECVLPLHAHYICRNEEEVLKLSITPPLCEEIETIWILGGVETYRSMMQHPWCEEIYLTRIQADYECDTFFPEINEDVFKLMDRYPGVPEEIQEEKGITYKFNVYKKEQTINSQ
uniref:Dihydrofolate reductase n=1 Tax=Leptobrachium leishanense TaxID=445787 RepID=A0A8C5P9X6_9ANUR